ncbi:uncharacterized protein LOC111863636 isoform X1 [Cryptotermes secundus]|uniref:uncharacterized protein LOC111863636 isoform X1 n=1 Tax=Cryptotermes secundus TaxID=105785 RepID=UPI000CD7BEF7|nr:uncharacterized protein LOC111863636 isoform X1 [Cryptotermes secundus]
MGHTTRTTITRRNTLPSLTPHAYSQLQGLPKSASDIIVLELRAFPFLTDFHLTQMNVAPPFPASRNKARNQTAIMLRSWLHCHCELNIRATKSRKTTTLKCTIERRNSNHYQLTQRMRKEWTDSNAALQAVQMMTLNNARMATHERQ